MHCLRYFVTVSQTDKDNHAEELTCLTGKLAPRLLCSSYTLVLLSLVLWTRCTCSSLQYQATSGPVTPHFHSLSSIPCQDRLGSGWFASPTIGASETKPCMDLSDSVAWVRWAVKDAGKPCFLLWKTGVLKRAKYSKSSEESQKQKMTTTEKYLAF